MVSKPTANLPDSRSTTLILDFATKDEQLAVWLENAASWKGALPSKEAYVRREKHLANQDLAKAGGRALWVLIDSEAKDRTVLSACETIKKTALVARSGVVKEAVCQGICSVWCSPHLRRRGYARRMMEELGKKMQEGQAQRGDCLFSVLFSDIGKDFYAVSGWQPFNSAHITVPYSSSSAMLGQLPSTRPVYTSDLAELCAADERQLRQSMRLRGDRTAVAVVPDIATMGWLHAREEFVAGELYGEEPTVKGAIVGTEQGQRAWALWTRMWYNEKPTERQNNILHILRIVVEDQFSLPTSRQTSQKHNFHNKDLSPHSLVIAALLQAAQREAEQWNTIEVEVWNPDSTCIVAARLLHPEAQVVDRVNDNITSLRWFGNGSEGFKGIATDDIDWVANEKYGWC